MNKNLLTLAGLAAFAIATPSFAADITIRITGSTAMRSAVHTIVTTTLGYSTAAASGTTASSAAYQIYSKGTSPNKTTIKTSWSGSVAGIQAVAQNLTTLKYLPDGTTGTVASNLTLIASDGVAADIAFSDVWQNASVFNTPLLTDTIVGVVQFRWVTSPGSPITNISPQEVRVLYESGSLPLSFFTGSAADATTKVYALGRDPDSGTRVTAFAETGLGTNPTVVQYKPTIVSGAVTEIFPYKATTLFGQSLVEGNSGESSGGTLAGFFRATTGSVPVVAKTYDGTGAVTATNTVTAAAQVHFIGYLGTSDAATAVGAASGTAVPGSIIAYAGENPAAGTALATAIKEGDYKFWSYLHCMHNNLTDSDKLAFYTDITSALKTADNGGITLGDMKVERFSDGGNIVPK
jgi:hypothetical protein